MNLLELCMLMDSLFLMIIEKTLISAQNAQLDKLKVDLVNGNRYYAWV